MAQTKTRRKGSSGSLNFVVEVFLDHALAVRARCPAPFFAHVVDLVLRLRDDHGHVGLSHVARSALRAPARSIGVAGRQLGLQLGQVHLPVLLDLVVHPHGGGLVDGDDHRLALEAAAQEVLHDVLGDRLQPVVAGDQVVLAGELALQLASPGPRPARRPRAGRSMSSLRSGLVSCSSGDAVLVVQRHGGAVVDRLLEVVDADVVAEDLARLLLAGDQRRAGEADEGGVGQGVAHVQRQRVVLAAVRLVGHHDDVGRGRRAPGRSRRCSVWNFWIRVKT